MQYFWSRSLLRFVWVFLAELRLIDDHNSAAWFDIDFTFLRLTNIDVIFPWKFKFESLDQSWINLIFQFQSTRIYSICRIWWLQALLSRFRWELSRLWFTLIRTCRSFSRFSWRMLLRVIFMMKARCSLHIFRRYECFQTWWSHGHLLWMPWRNVRLKISFAPISLLWVSSFHIKQRGLLLWSCEPFGLDNGKRVDFLCFCRVH